MPHLRERIERPPTHPGHLVRIELEELGLSVTEAAQRLGVARPTLSQLLNERKRISPEMALRLGRFLGNGTEIWLNLQCHYDRWQVERDREALEAAERIEPARATPGSEVG